MKIHFNRIHLTMLVFSFISYGTNGQVQIDTFYYTGSEQLFIVPACSGPITFDVRGGKGGDEANASGGLGGRVQCSFNFTAGDTLHLIVGKAGLSNMNASSGVYFGSGGVYSYSSGGVAGTGGGASDVRLNGTALTDRIIVAGGGGGAGGTSWQALYGGAGGGLTGQDGLNWNTWPNAGGKGGTQTAGGAAGIACCSCPTYTTAGSLGQGGEGSGDAAGGGGGGGGYYGGGGACFSGGGGGSSYTDSAANNVIHTQGFQNGNGMIILSYDTAYPISVQTAVTACDSFFVQGSYQTASGIYFDTLMSVDGCDSIVETNLTMYMSAYTFVTDSSCDSFFVQGAYQTSSGIYYDTLTTANGCDSVISTDLTITQIDTTVTQNDTVLTSNQSSATYQWTDCDNSFALINGATNQTFTPAVNGHYAVIISLNGCTDTSGCHLIKTIGMSEEGHFPSINVTPNPVHRIMRIDLGKSILPASICITDITGRAVISMSESTEHEMLISVAELPAGVYLLRLETPSGIHTIKFVKE